MRNTASLNPSTVKKRILFIDEIPLIAGGANSLLQLIGALDCERYEKFLVCPDGPLADAAKERDVTHIHYVFLHRYLSIQILGKEIPINPLSLLWRLRDAIRLAAIARDKQIDLIHTNNLDSHMVGWFLKYLFWYPVIWHIRIIWPRIFYRIPWPDRIIFVSDAVREAALGKGRKDNRAVVICNGIDENEFHPAFDAKTQVQSEFGLDARRAILGSVGRLTLQKGFEIIFDALKEIKHKVADIPYLIIVGEEIENRIPGKVSHKEFLKRRIIELGLEDDVIMAGHRSDIKNLVSSFDIFVAAFRNDANPRSVLEAMAMGKPVIGNSTGGVPAMLAHGEAGIVIAPDDPHELANVLLGLLNDADRRRRLGESARKRVVEKYTLKRHVASVEEVYSQLLD